MKNFGKYRWLANMSDDKPMVNRYAPDGRLVDADQRYLELIGRDDRVLFETTAYDHVHPEDVPVLQRAHLSVLTFGFAHGLIRTQRGDGGYVWLQFVCAVESDADGAIHEVIAYLSDETSTMMDEGTDESCRRIRRVAAVAV